jgi:hypothetical protein
MPTRSFGRSRPSSPTSSAARADRAPHRSRCRGDLLPRHSRPLCVNGRGGWSMQHPQSCRRQLPRRERLRGVRATRASWRSSGRKYRRFSNQELIFRRMRPAGLPTGIGYFLIGGQSAASHNGRSSALVDRMDWSRLHATMLRGRPQRRESCDLLNQVAGYSPQPSAESDSIICMPDRRCCR